MIRLGMILAAAFVATPAMAQTWVDIPDGDNPAAFSVDTDSIRPDGNWMRFQIRINVGETTTAYIDNVANCRERFIEARHARVVEPGKPDAERDFAAGEQRHVPKDAPGLQMLDLVCR